MEYSISPLIAEGLRGRILRSARPRGTKAEVLFIYGHHSSLERWQGIAALLSQRAGVTMPDLPGFGGMESFYKIGKPASLDNFADYVALFIKQHYKEQEKIVVIGMSLGFVIVTRMLQRHPELTKNIDKLVSLFGFAHKDDFILPPNRRNFFLWGSRIFAMPLLAHVYRALFLNRFVLSHTYHKTPHAREKFKNATPAEQRENMVFEISLWQNDDVRTYMKTSTEFLTLDNTKTKINMPIYHISVASDRYFNNKSVEKHLRHIFTDFYLVAELNHANHAPTYIANAKQAAALIPTAVLNAIVPI